ncbi:MAG TPA: TetR family transcriptional regulator [Armatimonadota bacterium]
MRQDRERLKEGLLAAAVRRFAAQGYDATTLDEVAADAGVTKGAIYWHFTDKADLFGQVMRERTARLEEAVVSAVEAAQSPPEKLRAFLLSSFAFSQANPHFAVLLGRLRAAPAVEIGGGVVEELRQAYRDARWLVGQILEAGATDGSLSAVPPGPVSSWIVASVDGAVLQWVLDPEAMDLSAAGLSVAENVLRALTPNPGSS